MLLVSQLFVLAKDILKILVLLKALYVIVDCNNVMSFVISCLS